MDHLENCKKNLAFGTRVKVVKTNSTMDGLVGTISGLAMIHVFDTYIVSLKEPLDLGVGPFQSFIIPETCLELVPAETRVFKIKPHSRSTKRVSMDRGLFERLQEDLNDGIVDKVEIRISKTNELLFTFPANVARLMRKLNNPYAPDFGYDLVSYAKCIKLLEKQAEAA